MADWIRQIWELFVSIFGKGLAEFIALVFVAVFGIALAGLKKFGSWLWNYHRRLRTALNVVAREQTTTGMREGRGLWLAEPIAEARNDEFRTRLEASNILVVANAKGGVGKTTTAANLGARFAEILPKPVLMIDLDFQGTLSSMSIAEHANWIPPAGSDCQATRLISGELKSHDIAGTGRSAAGQPRLKIITSFYDLAQAENRVMIEWLLGDRKEDIRFRLAKLLHDPAVRDAFSLIIIDSPPRLTTGSIQALAAATHLLIPTIVDVPSSEAAVTFISQIESFREAGVCPYIKHLGVVGSLHSAQVNIDEDLKRLEDRLRDLKDRGVAAANVAVLPKEMFIPRNVRFQKAVSKGGIAYIVMGNSADDIRVKAAIEALAEYVRQQMRL